ncbi:Basic helix-loop-helix transcription factor [Parasponia andersonii]|uniref:Basic helix-loop-helix transcription factor n=1 Tax=Parasponia andersonii TaxID=3476 RepID=A0A2P5CLE6_PARAD|nr:Basic helix-loop-helix transcription factor [Parasponia andersonii]
MALSFCSNWGTHSLQHLINQEIFSFPQTQLLELESDIESPQYLFDNFDYDFSLPDTSIDPIFFDTSYNSSYSNKIYNDILIPNFHNPTHYLVPDHDNFSPQTTFSGPKRQKMYQNQCPFNATTSEFSKGYFPDPGLIQEFLPQPQNHDNVIYVPPQVVYSCGNKEAEVKMQSSCSSTTVLSAQSIAARERRRKITEKTQELGRLIPGGNKMNTAEMFHAASKYIKFLRAQLAILQLIKSFKEKKEGTSYIKGLEVLASPSVQEKLYSEEKCLVPKEFVQTLANDQEIRPKTFFNDISQLIYANQSMAAVTSD